MQVNQYSEATSFGSKGSIKRMLKLPSTSTAAKDINKVTSLVVDNLYGNRNINKLELIQNNRTSLEKAKKYFGDRLVVEQYIENSVADDVIKVPFQDIMRFFDILSENPRKPISKLVKKFDKIPSLSYAMQNVEQLSFPNRMDSVMDCFMLVNEQPIKKAHLIPLKKILENTNESLNDVVKPRKEKLSRELKEKIDNKKYAKIKAELKKVLLMTKNQKDIQAFILQIQKVMSAFTGE